MIKGWHGWVGTFNGVALITIAVLPLAALAVWALARHRRVTGTTPTWAWRMSLAEVGIVYGTVPWVWMILLPGDQASAVPGRLSLMPLRDLLTILADGGPLTLTVQVVGNLLVARVASSPTETAAACDRRGAAGCGGLRDPAGPGTPTAAAGACCPPR
ncbi:hypothetical protein ACWDV4_25430 [Micromonospora sp. NPDC003197]